MTVALTFTDKMRESNKMKVMQLQYTVTYAVGHGGVYFKTSIAICPQFADLVFYESLQLLPGIEGYEGEDDETEDRIRILRNTLSLKAIGEVLCMTDVVYNSVNNSATLPALTAISSVWITIVVLNDSKKGLINSACSISPVSRD